VRKLHLEGIALQVTQYEHFTKRGPCRRGEGELSFPIRFILKGCLVDLRIVGYLDTEAKNLTSSLAKLGRTILRTPDAEWNLGPKLS